METIDVTKIEPRLKHPTIFQHFDALDEGESLAIHNDHDPKPLYYQMIAERGQVFEWEYLLEGPETWEVRITRLRNGEKPATIGELVAADYRKAEVFRKFGLDFCCGGKRSLNDACMKKGIDVHEVQKALDELDTQQNGAALDFNSMPLDDLANYIVDKHHAYVNDAATILQLLGDKVVQAHGPNHPELVPIGRHFEALVEELRTHMYKEERILFPAIREMAAAQRAGLPVPDAGFGSIAYPINMMAAEHDLAGDHLADISRLSNGYTPPADGCATYRVYYAKLQEFEQDLQRHIHLENNILFPKAILLERESGTVR